MILEKLILIFKIIKKVKTIPFVFLICFNLFSYSLFSQKNDKQLIDALNGFLLPIDINPVNENFEDLSVFSSVLDGNRIIALGEATHGTKDFTEFKHRLVKYLITELNYKLIVLEGDFAGSKVMNEYVLQGKGEALNALLEMGYGIGMTTEFLEMIEWIKNYNSKQEDSKKVKFYGTDTQSPLDAIETIRDYLIKNHVCEECVQGLDSLAKWRYKKPLTRQEKSLLKTTGKNLRNLKFNDTDSNHTKIINHSLNTIQYFIDKKFTKFRHKQSKQWDRKMAANCLWALDYETNKKMIIWAHNVHIAKKGNQMKNLPMGEHIRKKLGNEYYALGLGFSEGTVRGWDHKPQKQVIGTIPPVSMANSSDYVFSQCNHPDFFLDFEKAKTNPDINKFLNKKQYSRNVGASYHPENEKWRNYSKHRLMESYDGIIFIRKTSASSPYLFRNKN